MKILLAANFTKAEYELVDKKLTELGTTYSKLCDSIFNKIGTGELKYNPAHHIKFKGVSKKSERTVRNMNLDNDSKDVVKYLFSLKDDGHSINKIMRYFIIKELFPEFILTS